MLGMLGVTISIVFAFDYAKVIISTIKEKCLNTSFWNIVFLILLLLTVCSILYGGYKLIKSLVPQIDMKKLGNDEMLYINQEVLQYGSEKAYFVPEKQPKRGRICTLSF